MKIQMQLKDIIEDKDLIEFLGLGTYCFGEGYDWESWYTVDQEQFKQWKDNKWIPQVTKENKWDKVVEYCEYYKNFIIKEGLKDDNANGFYCLAEYVLDLVYDENWWKWFNHLK